MKGVVVLQVRSTSARLPGKAFLSIGGYPLAVLAAKRAANTGLRVICATSDRQSDDLLAETLAQHNLEVFRGDLHDVLRRFVDALAEFDDSEIVYRLTADNVFPDGYFISKVGKIFIDEGLQYLSSMAPEVGLPYGLSVEVTRVGSLRMADAEASSRGDREHVTAYLRRKFGDYNSGFLPELRNPDRRCTVDTLADYLFVGLIFSQVSDPIQISVESLVEELNKAQLSPSRDLGRLVLGGAQIGQAYGITNKGHSTMPSDARQLLERALEQGVVQIDTAPGYGDSEEIIGSTCSEFGPLAQVTTKLATLDDCPENASEATVQSYVQSSVYRSLVRLKRPAIDRLLLHRFQNLNSWNGCVLEELNRMVEKGLILELGVSVQTPGELRAALEVPSMMHIQMPFNILDHRWSEVLTEVRRARSDRGLGVYVRSVFLQGLLLTGDESLWRAARCTTPGPVIEWLEATKSRLHRSSIADLCIAFVRAQDWVDGVILGMNTLKQVDANIALMEAGPLATEELALICNSRPTLAEATLNPVNWTVQ